MRKIRLILKTVLKVTGAVLRALCELSQYKKTTY